MNKKIQVLFPEFQPVTKTEKLKTTINFIGVEKKEYPIVKLIPGIIVLILLSAVLFRVAVIGRFQRLWALEEEVEELQIEYDEGLEKIKGSEDLSDTYAHYTMDGFNQEELERAKRVDVADLVVYIGSMARRINNYNVKGRVLEVNITSDSLESISRIAMDIEKRDLVDSCSVQMAQYGTSYNQNATDGVEAQLTIYLKPQNKGEEE